MKSMKAKSLNAPHIVYSIDVYKKIKSLIDLSAIECQYDLFIRRLYSENNKPTMIFEVYDIGFMEQENTACHTEATDEGQLAFTQELLSTEEGRRKYNDHKGHGHSHVNMGVSPSSADMAFRSDITKDIISKEKPEPGDFFYFEIRNKKGEVDIELYDAYTCTVYDTTDVTTEVGALGSTLSAKNWAQKMLKEKVKNTQASKYVSKANKTGYTYYGEEEDWYDRFNKKRPYNYSD